MSPRRFEKCLTVACDLHRRCCARSSIVSFGWILNLPNRDRDLTRLGVAALFVDRRGHGRSGGALWPLRHTAQHLDDLEPDLAAAIAHLRVMAPLIDPGRIAVLGHSDGAEAAIDAGSADWGLRATIAMSPSIAPWQFVNHVAPQNLLLVFGDEDHFILHDTDHLLISRGTRGYLVGPGMVGSLADGTARRLLRIPGYGHVGVLYSATARRQALSWLQKSLSAGGEVTLSPPRLRWVFSGLAALLLFLTGAVRVGSAGNASALTPLAGARSEPESWLRSKAMLAGGLVGAWMIGLLPTPVLARNLIIVPAQEGPVLAALLVAETAMLAVAARLYYPTAGHSAVGEAKLRGASARDSLQGVAAALAIIGAIQLLLLHHYETVIDLPRLVFFCVFAVLALPVFCLLERWLRWIDPSPHSWLACAEIVALSAATAGLAPHLFQRMAVLPGYLLAAVLVLWAAYRFGNWSPHSLTRAAVGAVVVAWVGAVVCALY